MSAPGPDAWLTLKDAAVALGVDRGTITRYVSDGDVVARMGRVRASEVIAAHRARQDRKAAGQFVSKRQPLAEAAASFAAERGLSVADESLIRAFVSFATR